jgi:iron-sulfur cluster insertion protein
LSIVQEHTITPLFLSESAVSKVRELAEEEGNENLKLRVFVTGGGCSGFQYGFSFDKVQDDEDAVIQKDGMSMLVDPIHPADAEQTAGLAQISPNSSRASSSRLS